MTTNKLTNKRLFKAVRLAREIYLLKHDPKFWADMRLKLNNGMTLARFCQLKDVRWAQVQDAFDRDPNVRLEIDKILKKRKPLRVQLAGEELEKLEKLGVKWDEEENLTSVGG